MSGDAAEHALRELIDVLHECVREDVEIYTVCEHWHHQAPALSMVGPHGERLFRALVRASEVLAEQLPLEMES